MVKKYITENGVLCAGKESCPGSWISLVSPTYEECDALAREFHIDIADVRAALDDEESSRVDVNDEYTLVLFDIPSIEYRHEREAYTTIPLGLILIDETLITVCGAVPRLRRTMGNGSKSFQPTVSRLASGQSSLQIQVNGALRSSLYCRELFMWAT